MTAALNRATEEVRMETETGFLPHVVARAALVAALTDPDDPDWLARTWHEAGNGPGSWERASEWVRERARARVAVVVAAILGGAS